ncbi:hypothetical protein TNCV_4896431 [Trichonephila clavipes]|uniref:Uncharacterized protein n=1 Tax=Trichonephila clavipes TaxID=2585209 RepID=A0A8X6VWP4_TRICX|nr:hypothetical protein TNCV_4896431 [Trichonephila clavipes]
MTPKLANTSSNFHTTPKGGRLSFDRLNVHRPPLQGGFSVVPGSNSLPTGREFVTLITELLRTTRGLLATDHVILNHGQVTWTTPELAPPSPNYHTTPTGGRFSSRQI